MLIFDKKHGIQLARLLQSTRSTKEPITKMDLSALRETANILSGAFLNTLTQMVNIDILEGLPECVVTAQRKALYPVLKDMYAKSLVTVLYRTKFKLVRQHIEGQFIILLDKEMYSVIHNNIKQKMWSVKI
jgi:chemotaxis protein CheY-P-specific phosphatase CheC